MPEERSVDGVSEERDGERSNTMKSDEATARDFLEELRALCEHYEVVLEEATVLDYGGHVDDDGNPVTLAGRHLNAAPNGAAYLMSQRTPRGFKETRLVSVVKLGDSIK